MEIEDVEYIIKELRENTMRHAYIDREWDSDNNE